MCVEALRGLAQGSDTTAQNRGATTSGCMAARTEKEVCAPLQKQPAVFQALRPPDAGVGGVKRNRLNSTDFSVDETPRA